MKTELKVELKIKNIQEIKVFENVKELFVENCFLMIVTNEGKNKDKLEPIDLSSIDYWKEIGIKKRIKK